MRKIFYSMFALFMALSFTSCEDVPAPYDDPANQDSGQIEGGEDVKEGEYLNETFGRDFGKFTAVTVKGEPWVIDHGYAKGTGHQGKDMPSVPSDAYLISSEMDMTQSKGASITFEYVLRYVRPTGKNQVLATDNFTGDPTTTQWTDITGKLTEVNDWKDWQKFGANIPEQFAGKKKVVVALHYTCDENSGTWEVKNLVVKEGVVEDNPGGGDEPVNPDVDILKPVNGKFISETFGSSSFGVFEVKNIAGQPWIIDFHTAKASGYDNASKVTTASNSYIVSKPMEMTNSKEASINFEYILRYATDMEHNVIPGIKNEVLITDNYTGDPATTQWVDITGTLTEGTDWSTFSKFDVDVPAQFLGKAKVVVALHYTCEEKSATWEVKNLNVVEAKAGQGGGDEPGGDTPDVGDTTTSNGDFETWVDGMPNNWDGPASKANLFQSTDAHSGKFSVQVGGSSDGNMRLGYKTLKLKAGHYVMKFFVKAVTAEGGAARPGLVVLTDGKPAGGNAYKYGDYINDLKKDEWTAATHEFDIDAEGEYTVVVMNAKNPGKDILVDDFTLECNGEFIIK